MVRELSVGNEIYKWTNWTSVGAQPKCNFHPTAAVRSCIATTTAADQFSPFSLPSSFISVFFSHRITNFTICLPDWLHSRRQIIRYYDKTICERDVTNGITTRSSLHENGEMCKEQEFDLSVRCRWLPDDESRDASQKYALQHFKTRTRLFFQQTIIFYGAMILVARFSCQVG